MKIIGIDVGKNGGIAIKRSGFPVEVYKMPGNIKEFLRFHKEPHTIVFIEKVQMFVGDASEVGKAFGIRKMLDMYKQIITLLDVFEYPFIEVYPATWQGYLKLKRGRKKSEPKEEKPARKNRYKKHAQMLYPEVKATLWNADALLILHFGRLKIKNDLPWIKEKLKK